MEEPILDIQQFLDILKNQKNQIVSLEFLHDHQQDLFDQLPEHCAALQNLHIRRSLSDFQFVFRLKQLISLDLPCSIDAQTIHKIFEEFPFLLGFGLRPD